MLYRTCYEIETEYKILKYKYYKAMFWVNVDKNG